MGLLFWIVVAPLIAALVILAVPKLGVGGYRTVAFLGAVAALIMTLAAWESFDANSASTFQHVSQMNWFTLPDVWLGLNLGIGLSFGVDGLSLGLLTLAAVICTLAISSVKVHSPRKREYYFWISLASAGVFAVFTALDLFTFLAALEVTLFATFFLIYIFGNEGRRQAAFKFLIYRGLATVALLVAFIGIAFGAAGALGPHAASLPPISAALTAGANQQAYQQALMAAHVGQPTLNIPTLLNMMHQIPTSAFSEHWRAALFLVLLLAVFIEEAFVPFHTWLPSTHEVAETGTNMIIGGILTKTGAYVLLRIGVGLLPEQVQHYGVLLAVMGVINILYGAFAAWAQKGWRRLIAFSSISHMGLVLLGIAAFNSAGLQGAMFMLISSGLLTALLFYVTGAMETRTSQSAFSAFGGLAKPMPVLSGFLLLGALGSLGLPLTSGFISEIQAFIGGFGTFPTLSFVALLGLILSAVYMLYAIQKTTFGPTAAHNLELADAQVFEYVPIVVLTALVLVVGIDPNIIGSVFGPSVNALLRIGG